MVNDSSDVMEKDLPLKVEGIGGWLLFPAVGLLVAIFSRMVKIFDDYSYIRIWINDHPLLGLILGLHIFVYFLIIYLTVQFFTKSRKTPKLMISYLIINALVFLFTVLLGSKMNYRPYNKDEYIYFAIAAVIAAVIWIPYYMKSQRVKNTFVL